MQYLESDIALIAVQVMTYALRIYKQLRRVDVMESKVTHLSIHQRETSGIYSTMFNSPRENPEIYDCILNAKYIIIMLA